MAKLTRAQREEIARVRLERILGRHGAALARTIEMKISDAGPNPQRVDPHILTTVRNELMTYGAISVTERGGVPWYHLTETPTDRVLERIKAQLPVFKALGKLSLRLGQTLEIATYRALAESDLMFFGRFADLDEHDDSSLYSKVEPPNHLGRRTLPPKQNLDFLVQLPSVGYLGVECKNVREWIYPNRDEIRETLLKCCALDCVPVFIARRIPYVTFRLLNTCGCIMHQQFNQLLPESGAETAELAKGKMSLGYFDIRTGNEPDARLTTFLTKNMVEVAPEARKKFDAYKDLLAAFAEGDLSYKKFAAKVRRRENGTNEDYDWPDDEDPGPDPADWLYDM